LRVNAHTEARRRRRIFNVGRVLVVNNARLIQTREGEGRDSMSVGCLFPITPLPRTKKR
jgi:hypothetical protein